ncbi:MAG: FecR family protein [Chitinophaga sp.]|uniref:FecR family protein n=1 Tax=Chitinophaga sp. TaxID=1869181 RepID=UPI0025B934C9|nr:FecR family protein [Chitinophaga sp.]MBV8253196.1 FecR family protein [Chitinophaga sp.]
MSLQQPGIKYQSYTGTMGNRTKVVLPDSSTVILNSETLLLVPENYGQQERRILLDGDAWFEVKPDSAVFSVVADKLTSTVLGTSFRVHCFTGQQGATVYLLTGKLKVAKSYHSATDNQPEILERGQMILANREIDLMEKETYNPLDAERWLADSLLLDESKGLHLWRVLEDWYGVEIDVKGNASKAKPVSQVFIHASLPQVLDKLGKEQGFTWKAEGNQIEIKF